jgi:homoserine dehydrogenase
LARLLRIGIAGFGNVGRTFVKLALERGGELGLWSQARIVFVADSRGAVIRPEGLNGSDLEKMLSLPRGRVSSLQGIGLPGVSVDELLEKHGVDVLVDITPSTYRGDIPQLKWYLRVLGAGGAVVTADKAPIALRGPELLRRHGCRLFYKATVMAGTPLIDLLRVGLVARRITRVRGALNGTSNYVLSMLEKGYSLSEAIKDAQEKGYAEPDPSTDLKGFDLAAKAAIVACTIGLGYTFDDVVIADEISAEAENLVRRASEKGKKIRYVLEVQRGQRPVVRLAELEPGDPIAATSGALNVAQIETEEAEPITVYGPGAGPLATASSLLSDLVLAIRALRGDAGCEE